MFFGWKHPWPCVLTVLLFRSWVPVTPELHPGASKRAPGLPFAFMALQANSWICCPQLPYHPCKNGTHSTCFGSTGGHTPTKLGSPERGNPESAFQFVPVSPFSSDLFRFVQEPRQGGFLKGFFLSWLWRLECQMYCWAQCFRVFFVSLGVTFTKTPFSWFLICVSCSRESNPQICLEAEQPTQNPEIPQKRRAYANFFETFA